MSRSKRSRQNKKNQKKNQNGPNKGPIIDWIRRIIDALIGKKTAGLNRNMASATLPGAYANTLQPRFKVIDNESSVIVRGCDLITPVPSNVQENQDDYIFFMAPANMAYWVGTRGAQFAAAYMNYRPRRLYYCYIPQVSVNQEGTVVMGTLWNGAAPSDNLQQTLFTSNGGIMTQCYVPAVSEIKLGSNLPQNMFNTNGPLDQSTNPFMFLAALRGAQKIPGYFYVCYEYEFKNPVGRAWNYGVKYKTSLSSVTAYDADNLSVVPLSQYGNYGPGTIFGYDKVATMLTQNNRLVPISAGMGNGSSTASNLRVAVYYNSQSGSGALPDDPANPDDPVNPTPDPDPSEKILMSMTFNTNKKVYTATANQYTRFTNAAGVWQRQVHATLRWYVLCEIVYLDASGNPLQNDGSSSRANVYYFLQAGGPGYSTGNRMSKWSWYAVLGYLDPATWPITEVSQTPLADAVLKCVSGTTQLWSVFHNSTNLYSELRFDITNQSNMQAMNTINAGFSMDFDQGYNIVIPGELSDAATE